jgi:integrase/recombinase XerD
MGSYKMARIKLKYLNRYIDRHGHPRWLFRYRGQKAFTLPGIPGSVEFMEAYQAALVRVGATSASEIGAKRTSAGTINALIVAYYQADAFTKALAPETQKKRRNILERFRAAHGEKRGALLQQQHVAKMLDGMKPYAKKNWLKTIRGLMAFAIAEGIRADNPAADVVLPKIAKSMGHMTWLEPQVEQYRKAHALGTVARLALELLLNIAARRYDAHLIGPQHVIISNRDGVKKLCWRPHKTLRSTGKLLKVRVLPSLQAALDAMPRSESLAFLVNDYDRPFASAAAFGNKFADWCRAAGLQPVVCEDGKLRNFRAHGLRKAALRSLAHAGCTGIELMHVSGHSSLKQLQGYLEEVEQETMADRAMSKLLKAEG